MTETEIQRANFLSELSELIDKYQATVGVRGTVAEMDPSEPDYFELVEASERFVITGWALVLEASDPAHPHSASTCTLAPSTQPLLHTKGIVHDSIHH